MEDRFGRTIDYLRISITDRCNLRCLYCMPPEGIKVKPRAEIMRFEELLQVAGVALQLGISKFRLTGGEPLLRRGVIPFIQALALLPGVADLALTTNGVLLSRMNEQLWEAGVRRLNISLDTLDPVQFRQMTRGGDFCQVWDGIMGALDTGFQPVKLNVVALNHFNDQEWVQFARLTRVYPLHVRFIEIMPVGMSWEMAGRYFASGAQVRERIEQALGTLNPAEAVASNGPASSYQLSGAKGTIGFIDAVSSHFCSRCNRLRLTADGKLRPCLHDQHEVELLQAIRSGASDAELQDLFRAALLLKPANYTEATGAPANGRGMCQIGG
ncbi:MAG: GTP 3',8-cyclase MoaA [Thermacetogeniaceae bacterium]